MQLGHTPDPRDAYDLPRTLPTSPTLVNEHKNKGGGSLENPALLSIGVILL